MIWTVARTDAFSKEFRKYQKNKAFVDALEKKIKKLIDDPINVGGYLAGRLHGNKSTRLLKNFRLIFSIDEQNKIVYLKAIDHRKYDYKNFVDL